MGFPAAASRDAGEEKSFKYSFLDTLTGQRSSVTRCLMFNFADAFLLYRMQFTHVSFGASHVSSKWAPLPQIRHAGEFRQECL